MTELLVVRHAESEWNAAGRWQGHGDPPLTEAGRAHASDAADAVRGKVDCVVTSDLRRARETGEIIASRLGLAHAVDERLREVNVGEWTGLTHAEVAKRWPEEAAAWRKRVAVSAPGGENLADLGRRIRAALESVAAEYSGRTPLVVTHGAALGRLEYDLGRHTGSGFGELEGRWFKISPGRFEVVGDRVSLLSGPRT